VTFVLGAAAAARYTKQPDLLTVTVTPPLLFFCALIGVKLVTAGSSLVSVLAESLLTLAAVAPWLFAGVALNVGIGMFRGLPRSLADLRGHASDSPAKSPAQSRGRSAHIR
jgi:hypothetical protein